MKSNKRAYHHGDLRRVILQTAMDILREDKGWQFTLREVARRADVSHTAPYKHFPDKAKLLSEMALIGFDQLRDDLMAAKPKKSNSFRDRFFSIAQAYVHFGTSNPALYLLMFSADAGKNEDVHLDERALAAFGVLVKFLDWGQEEGYLRKRDIRGQAAACWAQVHGLTMLTLNGLLMPGTVGATPVEAALTTLLEGLEK